MTAKRLHDFQSRAVHKLPLSPFVKFCPPHANPDLVGVIYELTFEFLGDDQGLEAINQWWNIQLSPIISHYWSIS